MAYDETSWPRFKQNPESDLLLIISAASFQVIEKVASALEGI